MKKIYFPLFVFLLAFTSCDLDRFPLDTLSEKDLFSTESGLTAYTNSFYGTVFSGGDALYEDDADIYFKDAQRIEYKAPSRLTPASGGGWSFTALRKYNTLLDNIDEYCPDKNLVVKYTAIARFFRGYYYAMMVERFGDVPWIDHELFSDDPALYAERDSRETVMKHVIEDLNYAAEHLGTGKSIYTVTKWTALAVKSRACLFEGTFRKYHNLQDWEKYLQECITASADIIENSGYTIYNNGKKDSTFRDLFAPMAADGKTIIHYQGTPQANEIILARNYNSTQNQTHSANFDRLAAGKGRLSMNRKYVASFLMANGERFTDQPGWKTMMFKDECEGRDPRLAQCMRTPGYTRIGENQKAPITFAATVTGYIPTKYVVSMNYDDTGKNDNDLILFRFAEILLNWIEAKAELGQTIGTTDLDYSINRLRDRVKMPHMTDNVSVDPFLIDTIGTDKGLGDGFCNKRLLKEDEKKLAMILEIRRERGVELGQEGLRWDDIIRWGEGRAYTRRMFGMHFPGPGKYDLDGDGVDDVNLYESAKGEQEDPDIPNNLDISTAYKLSNGTSGMLEPRQGFPGRWDEGVDSLYPIPLQELELNKNLKQNPGYDTI